MQRSYISEPSCREDGGVLPPYALVDEPNTNAIKITIIAEKFKNNHFETLNLFQNACSMRVYNEFLGYIAVEVEERLVEQATSALVRLEAWTVPIVQYFEEEETRGRHRQ